MRAVSCNNRIIYEDCVAAQINLNEQNRVESVEEIASLPVDTQSILILRLTNQKVEALSRLSELRVLFHDGNSQITDAALSILGQMVSLEVLDLEWSDDITDQGLQRLYGLASLRWLDVGFCRLITPNGVAALRSALPLCEIDDDGIDSER